MGQAGLRHRLERIQERMEEAARRAGREPGDVRLVDVTKTVPPERVLEVVEAGLSTLGENYVQEAVRKQQAMPRRVCWHMIGHLQSNKVKQAVSVFDVFETVDRPRIVQELQRHAAEAGQVLSVMIQLNLAREASKSGAAQDEALSLIERVASCENLRCTGLITLPPYYDEPERVRPFFAALREIRDRLQARCPPEVRLTDLSMGMSGDFEVAIEEGATHVRVGTALFGPRTGAAPGGDER